MKFESLDIEVTLKPLPTKHSKHLNSEFKKFTSSLPKEGTEVSVADASAADFLMEQAAYLLRTVYKEHVTEFENEVTLQDVLDFLKEQIEVSGKSDFLIQPLGALIQALERAIDGLTDQLDKAMAS